ncbi:leucine zipper protein 2 isoform X4 [Alligator mississippiensis]|uniref:Leucine zipper protein 2 n=1 Tax=Alligator mississippiensis TaxID=8496 RepID=A0A151MBQ1_ALLMI|nr:leucine zipper protein 2 isoform X4 [Alligator mississippiensis]KYO21922.1 leucine zipper protein 2 [Alligator mississippiensis]
MERRAFLQNAANPWTFTHPSGCFLNKGFGKQKACGRETGKRIVREEADKTDQTSYNMKFISAYYLLPLFPVLVFSTRQGYEELERQLKEVFKERSNILRQLSKTSKELEGIKVNLQSLKNDEASAKSDVHKLLELGQKQREEMKSLQEAFQKQLNEAAEKAEKQQATINFLKTEMERKSKMIRDLQNENKSLKNKLLSGNKLCGIHAEESKKIQAQLKELRYGKKDLIFKAQQLTDLEQKLAVAKDELEKAALDKESQLKALKETVQLCLSSVLHNQPPAMNIIHPKPTERLTSPVTNGSKVPFQATNTKQSASTEKETLQVASAKEGNQSIQECDSQNVGKKCLGTRNNSTSHLKMAETDPSFQKLRNPPWTNPEAKKSAERNEKSEDLVNTKEKAL